MVLGRPGSGCSTLLKTLANQRQEYHSVQGEVWYDSLTPEQIEKHYRGDVQYCPDDVHFLALTTAQTLRRRRARHLRRLAYTLYTGGLGIFAAFICFEVSPPLSLLRAAVDSRLSLF